MAHTPLVRELRAELGPENVLWAPSELAVYQCDAYRISGRCPRAVVFPRDAQQISGVVRICRRHRTPLTPRGGGTSLVDGCQSDEGGVVLMLSRMNRLLEIDLRNRMAVVEPGLPNLHLSRALAGTGYQFAPDPASQATATLGGNLATNAGGPRSMKYGAMASHVLGVEAVLSDGAIVQFGPVADAAGLDLASALCGSEGTVAIVSKLWLRLVREAECAATVRAIFDTVEQAVGAVTHFMAAGVIPSAAELMDQSVIAALEAVYRFGLPPAAGAMLVIDVDGPAAGLEPRRRLVAESCRQAGAGEVLEASADSQRELLWKCRRLAVGALGRISPRYLILDGVVPRTRLPETFHRIAEIARRHEIRIANLAHAADGNLHPIVLLDEREPDEVRRATAAADEVLGACLDCGGTIGAEHGIGIAKLGLVSRQFSAGGLDALRRMHDALDPHGLLNPGKLLPQNVEVPTAP